jgi:hypothetical protein
MRKANRALIKADGDQPIQRCRDARPQSKKGRMEDERKH